MTNKTAEIYNYIANLYQNELKDTAEKLEKKRKIYSFSYHFFTVFAILVTIGIIIGLFNIPYDNPNYQIIMSDNNTMIFIGGIVFSAVSIIWGIRTAIFNHYAQEVKNKLFKKLYKALDKNLNYIPGTFKLPVCFFGIEQLFDLFPDKTGTKFILEQNIRKLKILPSYDYIKIDDVILGNYNNREVQIIEFSLIEKQIYRDSKGRRHERFVEVFHGALFQTSMEKKIKTNIFIKQKGSSLVCPDRLQEVKLESNEFEKIYEVYSNDQIESRYFLTTATMDNFIKLKKSGLKLSGYISGNKLNILVHASKDMFEPDINKPINNPNNYFDIIFQAKMILDIITNLKLESKTGL